MSWRAARSLTTLIAEVDRAHPGRPKQSDGLVGDLRHRQESQSDHNPNSAGVVTAWDCTAAPFCDDLAERLRLMGKAGDRRVKYVIWKRRIASSVQGWVWRTYSGSDPHTSHIHLSVSGDPAQYDRTDPWHIVTVPRPSAGGAGRIPGTSAPLEEDMTPEQAQQLAEVHQMLTALVAPRRTDHADLDPKHVSLGDVLTEVDDRAAK